MTRIAGELVQQWARESTIQAYVAHVSTEPCELTMDRSADAVASKMYKRHAFPTEEREDRQHVPGRPTDAGISELVIGTQQHIHRDEARTRDADAITPD